MTQLTPVEKQVLAALEHADGRVLSRADLESITGHDDRTNRMAIASLVEHRRVRIETAPTGGYFIPAANDPFTASARFKRQAFSLLKRARILERLSGRAERYKLQLPLFGRRR
jgi:hypothetical protein